MTNNNDNHEKEIDQISGVETTGHEWDGIKELNNPAPRWWLWVFYICVIWSIGYWVVYPAWPTMEGHTKGTWGWTQFDKLKKEQAEIAERQAKYMERFKDASFEEIMNDGELYAFANAGGASAFKDNCATCHGSGGSGGPGYPNLNDDDWLWGGKIGEIHETLLYGVRSAHDETRYSQMPAFGTDELLEKDDINAVVDYVISLSSPDDKDHTQGQAVFAENCASCHGDDATGDKDFGAPNLKDAIWLFGDKRADIYKTVYESRGGVMPNWDERLDAQTIRQLAVYVHQLGGGVSEESKTTAEEGVKTDDDILPEQGQADEVE